MGYKAHLSSVHKQFNNIEIILNPKASVTNSTKLTWIEPLKDTKDKEWYQHILDHNLVKDINE